MTFLQTHRISAQHACYCRSYGLTSEKKIADAADLAADANSYHPIRDYLNGLVWDGKERIRYCLRHFLGADTDNFTYHSLRLFLLGAIHRAFCPGCKFEVMLCLVGGQGAGKSTFFRLLAVKDEWFSDDLRKLDDDNVYRKLQGHWIIEMSEMMATANAKSIEEIKSFLSRQKEVYKIPYETHPADRPRQCVFGGTSNALDFLPLDRSGNRRFIPVMVYPEQAEVHILEDEAASRAYISQMWAEAMEIYRSGRYKLSFSPAMQRYLKEHQRDFMPEAYQIPASRCLATESRKVYRKLAASDLSGARTQLSWLVGRDTQSLSEEEVTKACVETVAENTSDGVTAPLFYLLIGGVPLGFLYKAVNTLDSMVGYRNETYRYFGTVSARLDDALNWLPSRICAVLMICAAWLLRLDARNAWRIFRRDRNKHLSPNSAQTESVAAGALGIRLGGTHLYFGKPVEKPTIGDARRPARPEDILTANRLMIGTSILSALGFGAVRFLIVFGMR